MFIAARRKFPSPFGVRVLKSVPYAYIRRGEWGFPSPFGVRVLKFGYILSQERKSSIGVSVPFRGSCSEISLGRQPMNIRNSFRPLSGFTF